MLIKINIIIVQVSICAISFSQWSSVYTEISDNHSSFKSVYFFSENTGYVTRGDSSIMKTTNGGQSWFALPSSSGYNVSAIQFTSFNTGYAIGGNFLSRTGSLLKTTNGGFSWVATQFSDVIFNNLKFIDDDLGYVLTDSNFVYKTINGGMSWMLQSLDASFLYSFDFVDANTGFVSGYFLKFYKTTNGGSNWQSFAAPYNIGLDFVDANTGYSTVFNLNSYSIAKTTNGGLNWFNLYTRDSSFLGNPFFVNNVTGWTVGSVLKSNNIYYRLVLKTVDGGLNWFEQSSGFQPDSSSCISSISMVGSNTGYLTTLYCSSTGANLNGKIFKTSNGGGEPIGIINENIKVNSFELSQNYPNPFNPKTVISYKIRSNAFVKIKIYNSLGIELQTLAETYSKSGYNELEFDGTEFPSGVYFYKIETAGFTETKKMVLIK